MGKVTLQTIADELGVSRTTVSNAYNRPGELSDSLRRRVMECASRLGYQGPHPAARALRSGHVDVVGIVLTESLDYALSDPYAVAFLRGLAGSAAATGVAPLLVPGAPDPAMGAAVSTLMVDRFCVYSMPDDDPVVDAVLERQLPTVFVDGPRLDSYGFVGIDAAEAMNDVVDHLVGVGHHSIGVLTFRLAADGRVGPVSRRRRSQAIYRSSGDRLDGLERAFARHRLRPAFVHEVGINRRETARAATAVLLEDPDRPSAVVCLSDELALGVIEAASDLGLRVPGDLAVTGFDDVSAAGPAGLTTVRQPAIEKGRAAWGLLENASTEHVVMPHDLVIRSTTSM